MRKKAQVTVFIIVAILIVFISLVYFLVVDKLSKEDSSLDTSSINYFVQSCLEETGEEVIFEVARGGGYYFPPEFSIDSGLPIYFSEGMSYIPSKKDIEEEISFFVSEKMFFCTRNFVDFNDFNITQGEIIAETKIEEEEIKINLKYPLMVEKGKKVSTINLFEEVFDYRLGLILDSVDKFISEQGDYGRICLSCLLELSLTRDFYVSIIDYDSETTIFLIKDRDSIYDKDYLIYAFANKYPEVEE